MNVDTKTLIDQKVREIQDSKKEVKKFEKRC